MEAAAKLAQHDAEARTVGFDGTARGELLGGVDAVGPVGTVREASATAAWV